MLEASHDLKFDVIRTMMHSYSVGYITIETQCTIHHLERLMPTCRDRGRWKWLAETKADIFDSDNEEWQRSNIDHADCFPRLYFKEDSFLNEFREWLRVREIEITDIKAPKF